LAREDAERAGPDTPDVAAMLHRREEDERQREEEAERMRARVREQANERRKALAWVGEEFGKVNLGTLLHPERPEREWVLEGFAAAGSSLSIYSAAGVGKSLHVLSLALAVARGQQEWAG